MNLCLLLPDDFVEDQCVVLRDRRFRHIRGVIRPSVGDTVTVGLLGGLMGEGVVLALDPDHVRLRVCLDTQPPAPLPVTVLLALPRPKSLFRILQLVATLGVKDMHFFNASRVEKSFWQSNQLAAPAVRENLILGLEQARDTVLPVVRFHRLFAPLVNDELPSITAGARCLVAHPSPESAPCPHQVGGRTVFALGPERGLIDHEVTRLRQSGFEVVGLGDRVLRVEQALTTGLARLI